MAVKFSEQSTFETRGELKLDPSSEPAPTYSERPKGMAWLWLFWEHRRFLGRVTIRGLVLAIVIAIILPPRFESTTRVMPPEQGGGGAMLAALAGSTLGGGSSLGGGGSSGGGGGGLGASLGGMAGDMLGLKTSGALFIEILNSRTVQDRLIDRFDLRKVYWDRYWETARKDLTKRTEILEEKKSGVIKITVTDRNRERAQKMAQAYVEELDHLVAQVSTSSARRERIFLEQRLVGVKQQLETDSSELSKYESKNTVLDLPSQSKSMVEAAAVLQGQLIAAESEVQGMEQIYTANNVRVRSLRARVEELRSQLAKIGGSQTASAVDTSGNPAASGLPGASGDQPLQGAAAGDLYPSLRALPLLGVRWLDLYRQARIEETVYELLTRQYEMAKVQEAKEIPTVKVLDQADLAERSSFPPRVWIILLGAVFSFALSLAWIAGQSLWRSGDQHSSGRQLVVEIADNVKGTWGRLNSLIRREREMHG